VAKNVRIVIVNYRTADLAGECLRSIATQIALVPTLRTVVIDNASGDGSVEKIVEIIKRQGWEDWASVLALQRNGGFAFGNNAGITNALKSAPRVDYVMLLNPDTFVGQGAIRALMDFMDSHPGAGIVGSRLENAQGEAEASAHNSPSPLGELESGARLGPVSRVLHRYRVSPPVRDTAHECDWVSGASLMIRRAVFEQIGLFDEGYFLYFEEVDFCMRARNAGWKIWFVPDSRVIHLEGASTGIRESTRRRPQYWFDSRRRYFVKHFGVLGLLLADMLWLLGRSSLGLRRALRLGSGGATQDPKWFALDLVWGDLRSLLTGAVRKIGRESRP